MLQRSCPALGYGSLQLTNQSVRSYSMNRQVYNHFLRHSLVSETWPHSTKWVSNNWYGYITHELIELLIHSWYVWHCSIIASTGLVKLWQTQKRDKEIKSWKRRHPWNWFTCIIKVMASLVFLISLPLIDALNTESPKRGLPDPNRAGLAYFTNATFDPVNERTKTRCLHDTICTSCLICKRFSPVD